MEADLRHALDTTAAVMRDRAQQGGVRIDVETVRWLAREIVTIAHVGFPEDLRGDEPTEYAAAIGLAEFIAMVLATFAGDDEFANGRAAWTEAGGPA